MHKIESWELASNAIILALIVIVFLAACMKNYNPVMVVENKNQKSSVIVDHSTGHVEEDESYELNRFTGFKQVVLHKMGVPMILQNPKFPTGCEAISLFMVLQYYGFGVSDDDLVNTYLKYWSIDYPVGFRGDPRSEDGGMMWPPALVDTANDYLMTQDTDKVAVDVSGTDFYELLKYLDKNIPVIIWVTERFTDNLDFDGTVFEYNGFEYRSHYGSHCVVITGYDDVNETIIINNPQVGEEKIEKYQLWAVYDACGRNAIIVE